MLELFVSPHCPHCKRALQRVNRQLPEGQHIAKTSVTEHIDRAVELGISSVPALVSGNRVICQGALDEQRWLRILREDLDTPWPE